jgi:diacylglycerol kinase (ATP)
MKTLKSFKYAFTGIRHGLEEHNMKVHVLITLLVMIFGFYFSITAHEWIAVILSIGLVIATELLNTALEEVCDIVTELQPASYKRAGKPKDIGAGAVLVTAITAAVVGLLIFVPYIVQQFK